MKYDRKLLSDSVIMKDGILWPFIGRFMLDDKIQVSKEPKSIFNIPIETTLRKYLKEKGIKLKDEWEYIDII